MDRGCGDHTTCVEGLLFGWEPAGGCTQFSCQGEVNQCYQSAKCYFTFSIDLGVRTHTMGVERACWQSGVNGHCDLRELQNLQDEKHALYL
eukprot:1084525-Pelagomonas_calceolata.AAC.1